MEGKEALKKLFFDNKDLRVDITLNDRKICEIYNAINYDLERLKKLESKDKKLSIEIDELLDDKLELVVKNKQQDILITKLIQEKEKYLKALDILKRFNFEFQFDCYYLVANDRTAIKGTLEELQLVKEVLGNE